MAKLEQVDGDQCRGGWTEPLHTEGGLNCCSWVAGEGGGEGEGRFQEAGGTGLGEGDTSSARDVSDQIEDQDQLLGARQKDAPPDEPPAQQARLQGSLHV